MKSNIIRMQMLFWNPFTSSNEIQEMDWYATLSLYALYKGTPPGSVGKNPEVTWEPVCEILKNRQ